jgi:hypothetical protein
MGVGEQLTDESASTFGPCSFCHHTVASLETQEAGNQSIDSNHKRYITTNRQRNRKPFAKQLPERICLKKRE